MWKIAMESAVMAADRTAALARVMPLTDMAEQKQSVRRAIPKAQWSHRGTEQDEPDRQEHHASPRYGGRFDRLAFLTPALYRDRKTEREK